MNVPRRYRCLFPNTLALGTKKNPAIPTPSKCQPVNRAICVRLFPKTSTRVKVFAASKGDNVDAITESRHRIPVMRSLRQSGQLRGSFASSLGCGTRMIPFLLRLTLAWRGALATSSRSSSVAVPIFVPSTFYAPMVAYFKLYSPGT